MDHYVIGELINQSLNSPDTKFECKPYNTYRFYQEEGIRYVRYLIFLNFCAIGCCIEHLRMKVCLIYVSSY